METIGGATGPVLCVSPIKVIDVYCVHLVSSKRNTNLSKYIQTSGNTSPSTILRQDLLFYREFLKCHINSIISTYRSVIFRCFIIFLFITRSSYVRFTSSLTCVKYVVCLHKSTVLRLSV